MLPARHRAARRILIACHLAAVAALLAPTAARAEVPFVTYIFPAGGQRGTTVHFNVGGHFLYEECPFEMLGPGLVASPMLKRCAKTVWFEGPLLNLNDSQAKEDYPKDQRGSVTLASDAALGVRHWRVWTSQGATSAMKFIVGELPEIVEEEIDGDPIPQSVELPVTINGRIFPREDVDIWTVRAAAGESITCEVSAARLGSPLEARLEVQGPDGRRLAENIGATGDDPRLRFRAPAAGLYQIRIHDVKFGGLQHYVYRLTVMAGPYVDAVYPLGGRRGTSTPFELSGQGLPAEPVVLALPADKTPEASWQRAPAPAGLTNPFLVALSDLPESCEAEPNHELASAAPFTVPAVLNGRIGTVGDIDFWSFAGQRGETVVLDLQSARLGSPLDSSLVLLNAAGQELARSDDISSADSDSRLRHTLAADGKYFVRVAEQLPGRGGPRFAYRLTVARPPPPDFRLRLSTDALSVFRNATAELKLSAERIGDFKGEINLEFVNLPADVKVDKTLLAANENEIKLTFKAEPTARIQAFHLQIRGTAKIGDAVVARTATLAAPRGEPELDSVLLAVAIPTPFKFGGELETKYAPRGGTFFRHFHVERGGYAGPIDVAFADRQFRHLQGVTGPRFTVPAGVDDFDYPVSLAPWMMLGRTSRAVIVAEGVIDDADGRRHKVSYASTADDNQIVVVVDAEKLAIDTDRKSVVGLAGQSVELRLEIARAQPLTGAPVTVELVVPEHIRGVAADPVEVPAGEHAATLRLRFDDGVIGPFNAPLVVRARAKSGERPFVAETPLTIAYER